MLNILGEYFTLKPPIKKGWKEIIYQNQAKYNQYYTLWIEYYGLITNKNLQKTIVKINSIIQ